MYAARRYCPTCGHYNDAHHDGVCRYTNACQCGAQYAGQCGHDVAWMTATEREEYGRQLAALDADVMAATQLEAGYTAARKAYGDSYADYLIRHDQELLAKGRGVVQWPASLQGNDGD